MPLFKREGSMERLGCLLYTCAPPLLLALHMLASLAIKSFQNVTRGT